MLIILHSSKTMQSKSNLVKNTNQIPLLHTQASELALYLKSLNIDEIKQCMAISSAMAVKTREFIQHYSHTNSTLPALDIFLGDIYSGLQVQTFTKEDREYANQHLFILSGLYGVLRALDEIQPYRLEMGYRLIGNVHDKTLPNITSLYDFWGDAIAKQLPENQNIINLSAKEYTKAVFPYLKNRKIISPKFLTINPKTGEPTFVTVHAKIARGAYARWLIQNRIEDLDRLKEFRELGYRYNKELSSLEEPVFVAKEFKGLGLSVRLSK